MPSARFFSALLDVAAGIELIGPRVFDLQIAVMSLQAGAQRLWTHDAGFVAVPGLRVEDPIHMP